VIFDQFRQALLNDGPPRPSENVADEENAHNRAGVAGTSSDGSTLDFGTLIRFTAPIPPSLENRSSLRD
jgi:hypothetical protein